MTTKKTGALFLLLAAGLFARGATAITPESGATAIHGALGLTVPFESTYRPGYLIDVGGDYYLDKRTALRASLGLQTQGTKGDSGTFRSGNLLVSGLYTFEAGRLAPFLQAGAGLYLIDPPDAGQRGRLGIHAGGGVDYFLDRRTAATGQLLIHFIAGTADRKSSFLGLVAGIRYHF